jgi:hypothetical protein
MKLAHRPMGVRAHEPGTEKAEVIEGSEEGEGAEGGRLPAG